MIEFRTLGTLQLAGTEGREVHSVVAQPKPLALLSYLVLESPDGYHRRDTLVGLLWPEYPEQRARHALSQALHVLRQELGEGVVVTRGQEDVGIDRGLVWCDAVAFAEAIEGGDYETALGLYRGDLLEGFFVSEATGFERWLGSERVRLQELAAGAAWKLAHRRIDEGQLVEAERTAQRAVGLVPTDESEVRRFVEALASAGDRAASVRFYDKFAERLRAEYELEPAPETRQLVEMVRNRAVSAKEIGAAALVSGPVSAVEAGAALASRDAAQEVPAASGRPSGVALRWAAAGAVVVVLVVAVAVGWTSWDRASGPVFVPNRVVVSLFENQTGDSSLALLALMAADRISDGLVSTGMLEVITPTAVREAYAAGETEGTPFSVRGGATALAGSMHAGSVVWGSLYRAADELLICAEALRMPGTSALGAIDPIPLAADDPEPGIEALRQRVMGLLAIHLNRNLATWATSLRRPPTYEAYLEFVAGLPHLIIPGGVSNPATPEEQVAHMLKAASLDTTFMAPLMKLVRTGPSREFRDSIIHVIEQRQHLLTHAERYDLASDRAEADYDIMGAYRATRRAAELAPDRLTDLAYRAFFAGRYREMVEILGRPDLPVGLYAYPWKQLTAGLHFLGEHERELKEVRGRRQQNPGAMDLMEMEGTALAALGRIEELEAVLDEGYQRGSDMGMHWTYLFFQAGNELIWHGYESEGVRVLERVVAHIRSEPEDVQNRLLLGRTLMFLGRHSEARRILEQLAAESQTRNEQTVLLRQVANAAAGMGDSEAALRISAQLESREALLSKPRRAWSTFERAQIAGACGDCEKAVELLREALSLGRGHYMIHRRYGFLNCRDYPPFQEVAKPLG